MSETTHKYIELKSTEQPTTITLPLVTDKHMRIKIDAQSKCIVNSITLSPGECAHVKPSKIGGWIIEIKKAGNIKHSSRNKPLK